MQSWMKLLERRVVKKRPEPGWIEENDLAMRLGFVPVLDSARGYGWCHFKRGDITVWTSRSGWIRAILVDGHYTNHLTFYTLEEALLNRNGIPLKRTTQSQ